MSFSFYVWYRVERDDAETERAVRGMMARLGCRSGVSGRLMKKDGEPALWLEAYEGVADQSAFQARLVQVADEFDIGMFIDGGRHIECFGSGETILRSCALPSAQGEKGHGQER